jgi:hypothetical protein
VYFVVIVFVRFSLRRFNERRHQKEKQDTPKRQAAFLES